MIPEEGHILILGTCEYVTLISKRGFRLPMEVRLLTSGP